MSVTKVLLDILLVLVAAKLAAEGAERIGVPAVVGEIVAGIIVGPSALGLVHPNDVIHVLGELGVILLLFEVGLEMDIAELGAVGKASLLVAVVGVIVPMAAGGGVALFFDMSGKEALFIGAALTATSVGITARVFGDLRALATVEARTVLGAAVADDVLGLVILTVVVRIVDTGTVSFLAISSVVGVAVLFLAGTSIVGLRVAPWLFSQVARFSRSAGTMVALALAFTLAISELASAAKLAPIVGAFVAGISLSRSNQAGRIRRELTPVGHLFIPVFFLQIGIDAEIRRFIDMKVLGLAAVLLVVAVVGKLVAAVGMVGSPGDRLLVGIGMIPRGEVGLIFATLGLSQRIIDQDVYASLLVVILVTTLVTPPLLRMRLLANQKRAKPGAKPVEAMPAGGWLIATANALGETVDLAGEPPFTAALPIALEAAVRMQQQRPGTRLVSWLASLPDGNLRWEKTSREALFRLLAEGGPRSWRFLSVTGTLDKALPELAAALARRQADPSVIDPTGALRWPLLDLVLEQAALRTLAHPERLLLAAVILDATEGQGSAVAVARQVVRRLDLGAQVENAVAGLVADAGLLLAASRRVEGVDEESVLQLATHLGSPEQARALAVLTDAQADLEPWEHARLTTLNEELQAAIARPELTGLGARNQVEQRRAEASRLAADPAVKERIAATPRAFALTQLPADLARQARLCEPPPGRHGVRVSIIPIGAQLGEYRIDVVAQDRVGLLARVTAVLADLGIDVLDASVAVWGDGVALSTYRLWANEEPADAELVDRLKAALDRPPPDVQPVPGASITFDDESSPWHTVCRIESPDRRGLLGALTCAFAAAGANVHSARIATAEGKVIDVFELTDPGGGKLGDRTKAAIVGGIEGTGASRRGRSRRKPRART